MKRNHTGKPTQARRLTMLAAMVAGTVFGQPAAMAADAGSDNTAAGAAGGAMVSLPATQVNDSSLTESPNGPGRGYVTKRMRTATKTDAATLTVPQATSTVTRQQMDDQGAITIDQALRYTTGVNTQDGTDVRFDQLRARGFDIDAYLDGLSIFQSPRFATARVDPYLLERIDVMFGPSSVLYGQGNPGGLVNYSSKLPTDQPVREVTLQIGNHDTYQAGFDLGGSLTPDGTILYRVVGLARDARTQVSAIKDERLAIAPSITFRPDRDTSLTLLAGYQRDPQGGLFNPVPASGTLFANPNGHLGADQYFGDPTRDGMQRTQYWFGYQFAKQLNDTWRVAQNARYLHIDQNYYQTSVTSGFGADQRSVYMWGNADKEHVSQWQIDTNAQAKFSTGPVEHTMLFGFDYRRVLEGDNYGGAVVGQLDLFNPNYAALAGVNQNTRLDYSLSQAGLYAQDELRYHRWVLTLGMREDWATTRSSTNGNTLTADNHAFTWRTGLAYAFDNGIAPYVSYAKSFAPVLGTTFSGGALQPTQGKQYEIGVRYQPKQYDASLRLSALDLRQENVSVVDPAHPTFPTQTGEVRSRGFEAEARANVTRDLKVIASYTYVNQVNLQSTTAQGKRPPITPRNNLALWADYTMHEGVLRNLGFGAGVRYMSSSAGDAANTFEVPSRTLVDAAVHYDWQQWRFGINVSNLFNREYLSYCTNSFLCYYGATRTVLGTARYQW
ncbi:TonB-dependent siderophore receptor [Pandoraea capi]|uniref:TonB-dependent siderophore receptor n=1 Tax=Pandoraea TaxID=93217 RepID=UPI001F5CB96F|nr:TonB-dependent siderophore receptor [Pandoraea capi]